VFIHFGLVQQRVRSHRTSAETSGLQGIKEGLAAEMWKASLVGKTQPVITSEKYYINTFLVDCGRFIPNFHD